MRTIVLVGLPGSGKTTVGRHLARRLSLSFRDTDHLIEERIGCSIREFFEREGEQRFRDIEEQVIAAQETSGPCVLATGGGAVLREANRQALRRSGHVVYLRAAPDELWRRLRHDSQRPLLQVADAQARLRELHCARDPLYRATADSVVETGRPSARSLANIVMTQLQLAGVLPSG